MKRPAILKAASALCALCAFLCMSAHVLYSAVVNPDIMQEGFQRYAHTQHLAVSPEKYPEYARAITAYLSGSADRMTITGENGEPVPAFVTDRENLHMEDVRGLVRTLSLLRVLFGALFLGLAAALGLQARKGVPLNALLPAAALGIAVFLLLTGFLTALALTGFDSFFVGFHRLFFRNDLWLMNPQTELLVALMPTPFFIWYGGQIMKRLFVVLALGLAAILAALLVFRLPKSRKSQNDVS